MTVQYLGGVIDKTVDKKVDSRTKGPDSSGNKPCIRGAFTRGRNVRTIIYMGLGDCGGLGVCIYPTGE